MQIDLILRIALGLLGAFAVLAFAIGFVSGRSDAPERALRRLLIPSAVFAFILLVGTLPLARKVGPVVTQQSGLLITALCGALLGGYGAGRKLRRHQTNLLAAYLVVTIVVVGGSLVRTMQLTSGIAGVMRDLGVLGAHKIDPVADKTCPENLRSLYRGFAHYVEANEQMPPVDWQTQDDLASAITLDEWLHCPAVSNRHDDKFGYAYNEALAGLKVKSLLDVPNAATTPLLYDSTNLGKSAHDRYSSLPLPGRHAGKDNVLYCDGHVAAVEPK